MRSGNLSHFHHPQIDLFVGDFLMTIEQLGQIDAVMIERISRPARTNAKPIYQHLISHWRACITITD